MNDDVKKQGIDKLDLSVRAYNCLRRAGVDTIEDVCNRGYERIRCIRGMGKKTLDELADKMQEVGICFKGE